MPILCVTRTVKAKRRIISFFSSSSFSRPKEITHMQSFKRSFRYYLRNKKKNEKKKNVSRPKT